MDVDFCRIRRISAASAGPKDRKPASFGSDFAHMDRLVLQNGDKATHEYIAKETGLKQGRLPIGLN